MKTTATIVLLTLIPLAIPAGAIQVSLSTADITWTVPGGPPSSTLTLHIEDLADLSPTTVSLRLSLSGHIEQDYPWDFVQWEVLTLARSEPRTFLDLEILSHSITDGIVLEGDSYIYYEVGIASIDSRGHLPSPLDWTSTAILTLDGFTGSETLRFGNWWLIGHCVSVQSCPQSLGRGQDVEVLMTTQTPEPGTGLLVVLGLVGLAVRWRRST